MWSFSAIHISVFLRVYPFLCRAVYSYVRDKADFNVEKELYISFIEVSSKYKVRDLKTASIGTLFQISGQVIRTHPVHPELVSATYVCLDCQTVIKDVEQQFKVSFGPEIVEFAWLITAIFFNSTLNHQFVEIQYVSTEADSCWMSTNPGLLTSKKWEFRKLKLSFPEAASPAGTATYIATDHHHVTALSVEGFVQLFFSAQQ